MRVRHKIRAACAPGAGLLRRLRANTRGLAMIEFAMAAPIFLLTGLGALELSHYALVNLRISQAASHIADNAARIGESSELSALRIYEADIQDLFYGVRLHAGESTRLYDHGRVILSSLERNDDGGQWIHWQRCMGLKTVQGRYGGQGTGAEGTDFEGMGPDGLEIQAGTGESVMFVEITYDYQPLVTVPLVAHFTANKTIRSEAAFIVRGNRDLTQVYTLPTPTTPSTCEKFQKV